MSMKEHPSENEDIERDTVYSPGSDRETEHRQTAPTESSATDDIDDESVTVLPGTGGPDDSGDVDVDPDDIDFDEIRRGVD